MLENSYYSVISPEGCATILFKDAAAAPRAAAALRITGARPAAAGRDGRGGARARRRARTPTTTTTAANLKTALVDSLRELLPLSPDELLERRYDRFRMFGAPGRQPVLPPIEEKGMSDDEGA